MLKVTDNAITNESPWYVHGSSKARLVNATPCLDETIAYVARVSSKNQETPSIEKLLKYCAEHGHWSVFEQGSLTVEVVIPLAISIQALRHKSFCFQQFSGRYQDHSTMRGMTDGLECVVESMFYIPKSPRLQDTKNRQNSIETDDKELMAKMREEMERAYYACLSAYEELIEAGIAKEIARFVLPQGVFTRLYITGNPRSFVHYCDVRDDEGVAQFEHVEMARAVREVFSEVCPVISRAVWDSTV